MPRDLGAVRLDDGRCRFRVWAPFASKVDLHIVSPCDRVTSMEPKSRGYHQVTLEDLPRQAWYLYRLDSSKEFPDPASLYQPTGVPGPSEVVDSRFDWQDEGWFGIPIEKYIIYEIHVGTFTPDGTFEAIIPCLDNLAGLGITALELMPIAQFPGNRNWGYDGVYPFAAQNSYGGPGRLKQLVNECHRRGIAVILDVVYNHVGPEENCLPQFGPYFTERYKTPWGPALNFDGAYSDEVRHFFFQNARYWIRDCHIDALRLDAVHSIVDHSALHFLEELASRIIELRTSLNRQVYIIAESALNDTRLIRPADLGGYAIDAQWNDDFHHSLHTMLTREREGYYSDFGDFQDLAQAYSEGFVYSGRYSANRARSRGNFSRGIPPAKFIVYAQNHDQIGNRARGDRLSQIASFEDLKLAAGTVILSPFIPLLFMGDEYGETAPFQYFVSHSDATLVEAVRRGRLGEFAHFKWEREPPDPQDEETFKRSKLNHGLREQERHRVLLEFHKELIRLRKGVPALARLSKDAMDVLSMDNDKTLIVRRWSESSEVLTILNFSEQPVEIKRFPCGIWRKLVDSEDKRWMGRGSAAPDTLGQTHDARLMLKPRSVLLLSRETED